MVQIWSGGEGNLLLDDQDSSPNTFRRIHGFLGSLKSTYPVVLLLTCASSLSQLESCRDELLAQVTNPSIRGTAVVAVSGRAAIETYFQQVQVLAGTLEQRIFGEIQV